jgi:hypothetical protein
MHHMINFDLPNAIKGIDAKTPIRTLATIQNWQKM